MPDNIASSYANSIDPAGGIQQPHAKQELSGHSRPIEVKADFNAGLPITAEQAKSQQTTTQGSEQVKNTNLGQNQGPVFRGPYGEAVRAGTHRDAMNKDGGRAIAHTEKLNAGGSAKKPIKGKAVVSQQTYDKLRGINARETMKHKLRERVVEARADQSLSQSQRRGRSI